MSKQTPKEDLPVKSKSEMRAEAKLKAQEEALRRKKSDQIKLTLAIIVATAGLVAYYLLPQLPLALRWFFAAGGVALGLVIVFFWSTLGRSLLVYFKESTQEMRKVVWPEKNDAGRMTMMVIVFVALLGMFIWVVDSAIGWLFYDVILKKG